MDTPNDERLERIEMRLAAHVAVLRQLSAIACYTGEIEPKDLRESITDRVDDILAKGGLTTTEHHRLHLVLAEVETILDGLPPAARPIADPTR